MSSKVKRPEIVEDKHPVQRVRKVSKTDRDRLSTQVIPDKKKNKSKKKCKKQVEWPEYPDYHDFDF